MNKTTKTFAEVLLQLGPFKTTSTIEVESRDATKVFASVPEAIALIFFDVYEVEIDGLNYTSDPTNRSEVVGRDEVVATERVFVMPPSHTIN